MNILFIIYVVIEKMTILFNKEVILEYILTKKKEYTRKLKEYKKQKEEISNL
jgi:nitric oxide synthase-interacting protein